MFHAITQVLDPKRAFRIRISDHEGAAVFIPSSCSISTVENDHSNKVVLYVAGSHFLRPGNDPDHFKQ